MAPPAAGPALLPPAAGVLVCSTGSEQPKAAKTEDDQGRKLRGIHGMGWTVPSAIVRGERVVVA